LDNKQNFLEELKNQYGREFEIKNSLETKANYNLAASGIIVGLLFTFGATLLEPSKTMPDIQWFVVLLLLSIGVFVISIFCSVLALRIKDYYFAFLPKYFYVDKDTFNEDKKNEYKNMDHNLYLTKMIDIYLRANMYNYTENEHKAKRIEIAHWLFVGGIGLILITILFYSLNTILK